MSIIDTIRDQPPKRLALIGGAAALVIAVAIGLAFALGGDEEATPETTTTTTTTTTTVPDLPVAPLTGLPGDYEGRIDRPALVVKIDNVDPVARPQAGVNQADVVYEERVEGSVTRLLAVFHSNDASPVGPVRSGRSSDIPIYSALNRPLFAWSGANPTFASMIRSSAMVDVSWDVATQHYFREPGRRAPSNLMVTGTADLLTLAPDDGQPPGPLFEYRDEDEELPAGWEEVTHVRISYGTSAGAAPVEYTWDGEGWARTQSGTPHVDADDVEVAPENVIIQFTPYESSGVLDQFNAPIREAQLVGEGDAWVLTDGGLVAARWQKESTEAVTTYTDLEGNPIQLTPGRTWVALPEPGDAARVDS